MTQASLFDKKDVHNPLDQYDPNRISMSAKTSKSKNKELISKYNLFQDQMISRYYIGQELSYRKIQQMLKDPVIAFSMALLTSIIASLPYTVKCHDQLQKKIIEHHLDLHYKKLMRGLCLSIAYGYAFCQKIYKKEDVRFVDSYPDKDGHTDFRVVFEGKIDSISKIKFISPSQSNLQYWVSSKDEEILYIRQYLQSISDFYQVGRNQLVWFSHGDVFDPVFGKSRLANVETHYDAGLILLRYLFEELDQSSSTKYEVRYPTGMSIVDGEQIRNEEIAELLLKEITEGITGYVLPSDSDPNSNEPKWSVKVDKEAAESTEKLQKAINDLIDHANSMKAMGLFVPPNLSATTQGGDFGDAEASMELLMFIENSFVSDLERVIATDFIDDILKINFRKNDISPYEFSIDKSLFNRRQVMKEVLNRSLQITGQAFTSGRGIPEYLPDLKGMLEQLDIPYEDVIESYKMIQVGDIKAGEEFNMSLGDAIRSSNERAENQRQQEQSDVDQTSDSREEQPLDQDIKNEQREESRVTERKSRKVRDGGPKNTVTPGA